MTELRSRIISALLLLLSSPWPGQSFISPHCGIVHSRNLLDRSPPPCVVAAHRRSVASCRGSLSLESVRPEIERLVLPASERTRCPSQSLEEGSWFKLICGASNQDVAQIRGLALAYTLAGADCIDCSADPAVVAAVQEGIDAALGILPHVVRPWVMVSVNDDEDPHFRKAVFDPTRCPADCPRPCEAVCPARAIGRGGVLADRCYGCGRCLPVCPLGLIQAASYQRSASELTHLLVGSRVDALEIHTDGRRPEATAALWRDLQPWAGGLRLVALSFPDVGSDAELGQWMSTVAGALRLGPGAHLVWQTDGRPMSGDLGRGTARAAVALAAKALRVMGSLALPGHVQLAGGTNDYTHVLLQREGLFRPRRSSAAGIDSGPPRVRAGLAGVAGAAFGGHARKILQPALTRLEPDAGSSESPRSAASLPPRSYPVLAPHWYSGVYVYMYYGWLGCAYIYAVLHEVSLATCKIDTVYHA